MYKVSAALPLPLDNKGGRDSAINTYNLSTGRIKFYFPGLMTFVSRLRQLE